MATKSEILNHIEGWPRTLSWNAFLGVATSQNPQNPTLKAYTDCLINPVNSKLKITPQPDSSGMYRFMGFGLKVELKHATTWVVTGNKTPKLLSHEQGHYDLAGVVAVDLCRMVLELTAKSTQALMTEAQKWLATYKAEWKKVNKSYDAKTEHGTKDFEQQTWKAAIQWAIGADAYGFGGLAMAVHYGML